MTSLPSSPSMSVNMDKLTYEIFSILETKFLFGYENDPKPPPLTSKPKIPDVAEKSDMLAGKVRILSIDCGGASDGILAAKSLAHLESYIRQKSENPQARIADYFDVVAGSGAGGILAALLFTRGRDDRPMFTANEALKFIMENRRKILRSSPSGFLRRILRPSKAEKIFRRIFGECTLKDTLKSVLIPCYDFATRAPFLFSRADAVETDGYDFKMKDVCVATLAEEGKVDMKSVDGRTRISAVGGGIAMNNPTAAAITHVLNNKQEFPLCNGVEDLLVVSLGNGESDFSVAGAKSPSPKILKIAGEGAADMVDQAISMAFGQCRASNYVRVQASGISAKNYSTVKKTDEDLRLITEEMLTQKNVESVLFRGKKMVDATNLEKLESIAGELVKEQKRRKTSILPTVLMKQAIVSPRTSSATTSLSTLSSSP